MTVPGTPPEAETVRSLLNISSVIALALGLLFIIGGVPALVFLVGALLIVFGIVNLIIYANIRSIVRLVDEGHYREAKNRTLTWAVIGFILGGLIVGILLLIAYLKYDDLIRAAGSSSLSSSGPE